MQSNLPGIVGGTVENLLSLFGLTGAQTAGEAVEFGIGYLLRRRAALACDILIGELKRSEKSIHDVGDVDERAAIAFRYLWAAQTGTARRNLRFMAKVIVGLAHMGNFVADEFMYYADILASLRREEIILIGTMYRLMREANLDPSNFEPGELSVLETIWQPAMRALG